MLYQYTEFDPTLVPKTAVARMEFAERVWVPVLGSASRAVVDALFALNIRVRRRAMVNVDCLGSRFRALLRYALCRF